MLQFGVIGAGRIGRVHVQNLRAGVDGAAARASREMGAWVSVEEQISTASISGSARSSR